MTGNVLIIGGSSGLGLEIANGYSTRGNNVYIAGRKDPNVAGLQFLKLSITQDSDDLISQLDQIVRIVDQIDLLVYSAGYYQNAHIDELQDDEILNMINVGLSAPALLIKKLKNKFNNRFDLVLITSSSQYIPRELEPVYSSTKAGLAMLGESLALDQSIGKVAVIAPSGMQTTFWTRQAIQKDISSYLSASWVSDKIFELMTERFKFMFVKILRDPAQVYIVTKT